jgi:hypothetical protein
MTALTRAPDDLLGLLLDDFGDRGLLDLVRVQELLEHRRLEDAEANPQTDASPSVSLSCSPPKPATPGCSTLPISSPRG